MDQSNFNVAKSWLDQRNLRHVSPCAGVIAVHPDDFTAAKAMWETFPALRPLTDVTVYLNQVQISSSGLWIWMATPEPDASKIRGSRLGRNVRVTSDVIHTYNRDTTAPFMLRDNGIQGASFVDGPAHTPVRRYMFNGEVHYNSVNLQGNPVGNGPEYVAVDAVKIGDYFIGRVGDGPREFNNWILPTWGGTGDYGDEATSSIVENTATGVQRQLERIEWNPQHVAWPLIFRPGLMTYLEVHPDGYTVKAGQLKHLSKATARAAKAGTDTPAMSATDRTAYNKAIDAVNAMLSKVPAGAYVFSACIDSLSSVLPAQFSVLVKDMPLLEKAEASLSVDKAVVGVWAPGLTAATLKSSSNPLQLNVCVREDGSTSFSNGYGALSVSADQVLPLLLAYLDSGRTIEVIGPKDSTEASRAAASRFASSAALRSAYPEAKAVSGVASVGDFGLAVASNLLYDNKQVTKDALNVMRFFIEPLAAEAEASSIVNGCGGDDV